MSSLPDGSTRAGISRPGASREETPSAVWNARECAKALGISEKKLRRLADDGKVPHFWIDEEARFGLRFIPAVIREWEEKKSNGGGS